MTAVRGTAGSRCCCAAEAGQPRDLLPWFRDATVEAAAASAEYQALLAAVSGLARQLEVSYGLYSLQVACQDGLLL